MWMTATQSSSDKALVLRTAAVWGTYVLASRELARGEPLAIGDAPGALVTKPDECAISELPIRAVGNGWELDARGVTGGLLHLRGRREDPVELGRAGAPIPIVAGDYGVLQYGNLSLFFQYSLPSPPPRRVLRIDWPLLFAFLFALVTCGGVMLSLYLLFPSLELPKPLELTSSEELSVRFHHKEPPAPPLAAPEGGAAEGEKGAKDARPKAESKGKNAKRAPRDPRPSAGERREPSGGGLSAITDVMQSEVGREIHETLGAIGSVSQALGALDDRPLVLGGRGGTGLKSSGGSGGDGRGVLFGAGTLDTGSGTGAGAAGRGRGAGGSGRG